jgi:hypothetical protein
VNPSFSLSALSRRWRAFAGNQSGNILILFALTMPAALGFAALGTEGGELYLKKAALQAAADQAAVSAVNSFNTSSSAYTIEAKAVAASMGFVDDQNGVTVTVNYPPKSGSMIGKTASIEVIISLSQPPMLSRLFHPSNFAIDGRAVATFGGPACVLALDPTAKSAISAGGSTIVNMPKCNLISDSNASNALTVSGSASVTINEALAVGGISATSGLVDNANVTGAAPAANPYSLSIPKTLPACVASGGGACANSGAANLTLNPGTYNYKTNPLKFNAGQVVTLNPGVYYIDQGALDFEGGTVTGKGVTFVLTSSSGNANSIASLTINGNASFNITAPTSGPFSGVVLYDDPRATANLTVNGNSNTYFGGAIDAPSVGIKFAGTGVSGNGKNCTQIIGDTVTFTGNSSVSSDCGGYGTAALTGSAKTVLNE